MDETLKIKVFHMEDVLIGNNFEVEKHVLKVKQSVLFDQTVIDSINLTVIRPNQHQVETNTIMDIIPISTKVLGTLGNGITHTLTGVYVMLTGRIIDGEQFHEFGSSEGVLSENIRFNRVGTPNHDDFIIHVDVLAKAGMPFNRKTVSKAFEIADDYIQEIREELRLIDGRLATEVHTYEPPKSSNKPEVVLVKQVPAQGAMYDALVFPNEPSGYHGGTSVIDMKAMPLFLTANEYRDGAIRSMD